MTGAVFASVGPAAAAYVLAVACARHRRLRPAARYLAVLGGMLTATAYAVILLAVVQGAVRA